MSALTDFDERFAQVRDKLQRICSGLVGPELAQDIVQDTYLRARSRFHQLREADAFDSWLVRIAVTQCYNATRRRRRSTVISENDPGGSSPSPHRDVGLRELVAALPPKERTLVVLHYGYGYRVDEIATMVGVPAGTARSILFRARKHLGAQLVESEQ
jgi:RNA polymerase sigma-70 factor (ECF subfamily)